MSTDISVVSSDYPVLTEGSREAMILAKKFGDQPVSERDLPSIKTPAGGSTTFTWSTPEGTDESATEITGILVADAGRGDLWPSREPSGTKPLITTRDLKTGYKVGDDFGDIDPAALEKFVQPDGTYDWAAMSDSPEFGFGSAGRGKRVKEQRVIAILRPGEIKPVLVKVSGGSLASFGRFERALSVLNHEAIVTVSLEKVKNAGGQPYSRLKFSLAGTLSPQDGDRVYAAYTKPLTAMLTRKPWTPDAAADDAPF